MNKPIDVEAELEKLFPRPAITYADHSYPAYSKKQMLEFGTACAERDAPKWQSIESAPKDGTTVRLMNIGNGLTDVGQWCDYRGQDRAIDGEWNQVNGNGDMTHWMPLPPPEKDGP